MTIYKCNKCKIIDDKVNMNKLNYDIELCDTCMKEYNFKKEKIEKDYSNKKELLQLEFNL